jgi:hypothetical protein
MAFKGVVSKVALEEEKNFCLVLYKDPPSLSTEIASDDFIDFARLRHQSTAHTSLHTTPTQI